MNAKTDVVGEIKKGVVTKQQQWILIARKYRLAQFKFKWQHRINVKASIINRNDYNFYRLLSYGIIIFPLILFYMVFLHADECHHVSAYGIFL